MVANESENPNSKLNRDKVKVLLRKHFDELRATMHVSTSSSRLSTPGASTEKREIALASYWPKKSMCSSNDEFENAVGLFFQIPELTIIREKMDLLDFKSHQESILVLENAIKYQKTVSGYVYALWNPLFPDLLKIGATFRTPEIRARELSGTGMPEPFQVVAQLRCCDPFNMEREIHGHFAEVRKYGKKKEFFILGTEVLKQYLHSLEERAMKMTPHPRRSKLFERMKKRQSVASNDGSKKKMKTQDSEEKTSSTNESIQESHSTQAANNGFCAQNTQNLRVFNQECEKFISIANDYMEAKKKVMEEDHQAFVLANEDQKAALKIKLDAEREAVETKQRLLEMELKAKAEHIALERQASLVAEETKQREVKVKAEHIELERQASIIAEENKQRELKMEREMFEFMLLKKKHSREEEETAEDKKKMRNSSSSPAEDGDLEEGDILTVRDVLIENPDIFKGIPKEEHDSLVRKAVVKSVQEYRRKFKASNTRKVKRGRYNVAAYKTEYRDFLLRYIEKCGC